jgi:hypothetical protein
MSDAAATTTKKPKAKSSSSSSVAQQQSEVDPFAVFAHEAGSKADFARVPGEALLFSAQTQLKLKGNKVSAGTMHVSTARVVWCAAGSVTPSMSFPFGAISNHQYSPPDAPQVLVKLVTASGTFVFVFSSPTTAQSDRNSFRELLSQVKKPIKQNPAAAAGAANPNVKSEAAANAGAIKPEPTNQSAPILPDGAADTATADDNKLKILPARPPMHGIHITEARRRADLLAADSQVKLLHAELVLSGIVSEEDFWQMRQDDLRMAADRPRAQQRGVRSALIADVEPVERNAEKEHYRLTPSVIRAIFEAAPPVQRAFQQLVPDRLSEQEFWAKYLAARHFHRAKSKTARRRSRTNETAEDALLARAIEEAERDVMAQSLANVSSTSSTMASAVEGAQPQAAPVRPDVPLDIDMAADDALFEREHYGQRLDTMMRAEPSAAVASVVARTNQHSARVLATEADLPSIIGLVRRTDNDDDDRRQSRRAPAIASQPSGSSIADDLTPQVEPATIPLELSSRSAHTLASTASDVAAAATSATMPATASDDDWRRRNCSARSRLAARLPRRNRKRARMRCGTPSCASAPTSERVTKSPRSARPLARR